MSNRTGRKLALELRPSLLEEICQLLERGASLRTTCEACGLSESAFFEYVRRGQDDARDFDPQFAEFAQRTTRARGRGKARLLALAWKHAETDGRVALDLLGRISPREYGRNRDAAAAKLPSIRADSGVLGQLLRQEQSRQEPDAEKIQAL